MQKKIQSLIANQKKREVISLAAYNKSKEFDINVIVNKWEELFNSI